ncbi:MAG TPA: calcium-binding protein [Solirubrobacteraceae bacterium]|jgi:Ca2+-binding RTX toxin-like protein
MRLGIRTGFTLIASCGVLLAVPAGASALGFVDCTYDAATHTLAVSSTTDYSSIARIQRSGSAIDVDGCTAGETPATVTNTDTITISGRLARVELDLSGGPLAPGASPEADGSPEIEIEVDATPLYAGYQVPIIVEGSLGAENLRAGTAGGQEKANLNAGEAVGDADLTFPAGGDMTLHLHGRDGDDVIDGRGGAGTGSAASILASGEAGNDQLFAGTGSYLAGGPGDDTLAGGPGNDSLVSVHGNDTISGGDGVDTLKVREDGGPNMRRGTRVDLDVTAPQDTHYGLDTISGIENVMGTLSADILLGSAAANHLTGVSGSDVFVGRGGDDVLEGAGTADYRDAGGPVTVDLTAPAPQATGAAGNDTLLYVDHLIGTPYADSLTGNGSANRLEGGAGADTLRGGGGTDRILIGSTAAGKADGADDADGGAGIDTLSYLGRIYPLAISLDGVRNDGADPNRDGISSAKEENDLIAGFENVIGGGAPDRLVARWTGVNVLDGQGGADFIDAFDGSSAADRLACGLGADTYKADPSDALDACETAAP